MASSQIKLAESLQKLKKFQNDNGVAVIRFTDLSRVHLKRLLKNGFLQEVLKGWYVSSRPDSAIGDTTNWFTAYWFFIADYANSRFGKNWCLSAEQSLSFHSGNKTVPRQIIIRTAKGSNNIQELLHNTSILYFKSSIADPIFKEPQFGLNLYLLPEALIECSPEFFKTDNIAARTCLSLVTDISDILKILLKNGQTTKAGRLAGAFRNIGRIADADEIIIMMKELGYDIREENPFIDNCKLSYKRTISPYTTRLTLMWREMRETILESFTKAKNKAMDIDSCIKGIDTQYKSDAYNSLSIEGYQVTNELIEKVKTGKWNPEKNTGDAQQRNAMAARGYWQAFQAVKKSIAKILSHKNPGEIVESDLKIWYRELFAPSTMAGLLKQSDLVGYRAHQVYIRSSMHTPLSPEAVKDAMPVLFDLLKNELDARVRAVLGHFFFVYIHPYMDGNGRIGRFLMNTMLASGGYNWTIVPVEKRNEYMSSLEKASVGGNITDFAHFIASLERKRSAIR